MKVGMTQRKDFGTMEYNKLLAFQSVGLDLMILL
jgi:hypothetical protein